MEDKFETILVLGVLLFCLYAGYKNISTLDGTYVTKRKRTNEVIRGPHKLGTGSKIFRSVGGVVLIIIGGGGLYLFIKNNYL